MAFGSMRTSSASGSWSRRAIDTAPRSDTSRSGNSAAASSDAEYTDAPASETTMRVSGRSGLRAIRSAASLSVSRDAVPLPIAMSCTPCARAQRGQRPQRAVPVLARLVRVDRRGLQQLAGAVDDRDLDAGADAGVQPHRDALAGRRRQQQVVQVAAEHADRFGLRLLAQLLLDLVLELRAGA